VPDLKDAKALLDELARAVAASGRSRGFSGQIDRYYIVIYSTIL
jgi:predicted dienelactone hydrolase